MLIHSSDLKSSDAYHLLTSLLVPRPIAWVGTRSPEGVDNLAPFSYFMGVGSRPPALAISVARKRTAEGFVLKDTTRNILATDAFTVSIVSRSTGEAMASTAGAWPAETSEFAEAGLTAVPGEVVAAPHPAEARVALECRLMKALDLDSTHLIVGEIVCWHVDDSVLAQSQPPIVDARALDPLGRLGGTAYTTLGDLFEMVPPQVLPSQEG